MRDAKYNSLRETTLPTVYVPLRAGGARRWASATLEVRTASEPGALATRLRQELPRVHPSLRITDVVNQSTLIDDTLVHERMLALLSGFFATAALLLAAVGLYGVLSYGVARRTREIGIRLALGARRSAVVGLVVGDVTRLAALGILVGLAAGIALARLLATLLFEVRPSDFWSVALPLCALLLASALAALPAALRAVRVDPTVALRYE